MTSAYSDLWKVRTIVYMFEVVYSKNSDIAVNLKVSLKIGFRMHNFQCTEISFS